jgi:hypothetical protein
MNEIKSKKIMDLILQKKTKDLKKELDGMSAEELKEKVKISTQKFRK